MLPKPDHDYPHPSALCGAPTGLCPAKPMNTEWLLSLTRNAQKIVCLTVAGFQWEFANRDSTPSQEIGNPLVLDDPTSVRQHLVDVLTGAILGSDWHAAVSYRCWNDFLPFIRRQGALEGIAFVLASTLQ
jgi:hypothetical protein